MTGNYYGMVFYGCTVWFDKLKTMYKAKLMSAHFRLLRTACKDYNVQLSKSELTQRCERANPFQWVNFLTASKVVKITRDKQPVHLYNCITFMKNRENLVTAAFMTTPKGKLASKNYATD